MLPQHGQLRIAAPKPVYSALHHRSFVLQDVRAEGELAPSGEPREPERSGEPIRTSTFSPSTESGPTAFHQNQQPPPGSFRQQLPVLPLSQQSQQQEMIQSHPPHSHSHSPSVISARSHHSAASASTSFAKSRIGSKTPPALFNPTSTDSSVTTRQAQIKFSSLGHYPAPSPPLSGGRPLPAVPLVSQDSTSSSRSNISHRSATHPSMTTGTGFDKSTWPRSSASLGSSTSSASSKSPHTHLSLSTPSTRTKTPPSLIHTASGSSTAFPMPSDISTAFDGDNASKANNGGRGGNGSNTIHETQAQGSHVQSTHAQGTQGAQGVTYSYAFHPNQNQSTSSSSSSSVLFGSAALSSPALVTSPFPLSPPPPPPPPVSAMVAMAASPASGHVPNPSVGATTMTTKSGGSNMEGAGNWSVSKEGSNPNTGTATNSINSNSSKINNANNSGNSSNNNTALVRPLPLPPGSTPRARTRSNNASNVLGVPPGSHTSSVNVLSLPISWASRPVDLNRSVPVSSSVNAGHAGHSGGEHQQHALQQHQQQPGQQIQQGQGQQQKTYSRPPSRPSLRPSRPSSRSSRPSSPSAPSPPPRPPSNLAFGPGSGTASSASASAGATSVGTGRPSSPPRSKTITSTTRRGARLRSRSTSRPKTQVPAGGVLKYESFSGVATAMGTSAAAPAMTSPTAPPNTAPLQARPAPQGSRTIPPARKRSATESSDVPPNVVITKSQPVGSGLSGLTMTTNKTTSQPTSRQASKRSAIPPRSTPPQSQLPSPPSVSHHHGISHGHASSSGLTPGHNTSLLTPLSPTTQGAQSSGSKRHQGGVQLSRQLVSRAAAVPAPVNPNYNCVGVAKGGVYYVRDKDPYPYHQRRQDEKGKESETSTTLVSKKTLPVRPLPKPGVLQPLSSDKQPAGEDAGIDADAEDGAKPDVDDNDDDGISCLSYIDSPDSAIGVHPDLGSLSFTEDDDIALSDGDPLLVYIDDNFDSSDEDKEFVKSVSPMRYARPGSAGTVISADDGGSDMSSDFFSDVDDPFKYNKGRSKRRGRTRTTVPVGLGGTGEGPNEIAGGSQSHKEAKGKPGIRMTGSLGSMRDLIESKAAKEKRKKEAETAGADGGGGAIAARTKSAERDRALPQRYGHPQESPLPPPPPQSRWFTHPEASSSKVSLNQGVGVVGAEGSGSDNKLISPVSLSSSQGGSLSPMRYAKRMSIELLDDSSSVGSPISPVAGVGGLLKGKHAKSASGKRKKRSQPWSYQFDYQAAKASSPFTFGMGGEKAATTVEEKREEEKRKIEEGKKREKAKSLRGFKTKEEGESRKKLSIDVLDISLLRRSSQPTLLEPSAGGDDVFGLGSGGDGGGGGSGGSGQQTFRTWDDSPASSATASSFTVIAAADTNNPVVITPPAHSSPPPIATTTSPPSIGRARTFKVRNP